MSRKLVLGEIEGRPLFMQRPKGAILLLTRPFQLVSRWLGFCRFGLIAGRRMLVLPVAYILRPSLGDDFPLRRPELCLSPEPFLEGQLHGTV